MPRTALRRAVLEHPPAALVLLQRFTRAAGGAEELNHADVRSFRERIEEHACARMRQRGIGCLAQPIDERRQDRDPQSTDGFALRRPPLVIAIAVGEIQFLEKFAAEAVSRAAERIESHAGWMRPELRTQLGEIDRRTGRFEPRAFVVGDEASDFVVVQQRADFRQAPAQGGARIVGTVPQQLAQMRARVRTCRRDEIGEERPRFLRRRQRHGPPVAQHLERTQHADREQHPT